MVGAEELGLALDKAATHALEERVVRIEEPGPGEPRRPVPRLMNGDSRKHLSDRLGDVAGEALEHGGHAEGALAGQDLALERDVIVDPAVGEWAPQAVNVGHPSPGQVRRPHQEVGDLLPAESEVSQDAAATRPPAR